MPGAADVPAGRIAVVAASGGVNHAVAFLLAESGHGVSVAVGLGNGADVTAPDVLDYLAADPHTAAIALHVESVADGPRLVAAVSRLAAAKPVVALVVGRHDVAAFARSHTGALATSWRTTRAALRQAGAVLVDSERELVDAVGALSLVRLPPGASGVGVLTGQAGPGLLLLDDLRGRGASVPDLTAETQARIATLLPPLPYQRNPVDTGRPGPEFASVLSAVAADPGIDVVAAYALHEPDALDLAAAVEAAAPAVPVVTGVGGTGPDVAAARRALVENGVPALPDPAGVAAAVAALLADSAGRRQESPGMPSRPDVRIGKGPWDEAAAKDVLDALGIPTPPRRVCRDRDSAQRALAELGGPVAVKLLDATVLHKTEIGGSGSAYAPPRTWTPHLTRSPPTGCSSRPWHRPGSTSSSVPAATRCSGRCCSSGWAARSPRRSPTSPCASRPCARTRPRAWSASWPGARCSTAGAGGRRSTGPRSAVSSPASVNCCSRTRTCRTSRSTRCGSPRAGWSRSTP